MSDKATDRLQQEMFQEMQDGKILERAARYGKDYAASVCERRVYPDEDAIKGLDAFDEAIPEVTGDAVEVLERLHTAGSPGTVAQTGGRYFGMVNGALVPAALGARVLADVWDQNAVLYATSPVNSKHVVHARCDLNVCRISPDKGWIRSTLPMASAAAN